ncbi:hypothetical protein I4I83_09330 [Acidovorax cattleyae]|nr:hypothetical protein [Paracidovorax cattleyae]
MFPLISPEAQVMLAICAFYAYDACVPLAEGAGLVRRPGRTRWHAMLATQGFEVRWAYLAWPALLWPHQPVYLLRWQSDQVRLPGDAAAVRRLQAHADSFRHFTLPLYGLGASLFLLLPAALFVWPGEAVQLAAAAMIYLFAAWTAAQAWRHGNKGHSPRSVARSVAVQALACPPFALNSVRKLAAAYAPGIDLLQAAHQLLDPPAWHALAHHAQAAIEADIEAAQAESPAAAARSQRLSSALRQLQAHMPKAPGTAAP